MRLAVQWEIIQADIIYGLFVEFNIMSFGEKLKK